MYFSLLCSRLFWTESCDNFSQFAAINVIHTQLHANCNAGVMKYLHRILLGQLMCSTWLNYSYTACVPWLHRCTCLTQIRSAIKHLEVNGTGNISYSNHITMASYMLKHMTLIQLNWMFIFGSQLIQRD